MSKFLFSGNMYSRTSIYRASLGYENIAVNWGKYRIWEKVMGSDKSGIRTIGVQLIRVLLYTTVQAVEYSSSCFIISCLNGMRENVITLNNCLLN